MSEGILPYTKEVDGALQSVQAMLEEPLTVQFYPAEEPELSAKLHWASAIPTDRKGAVVGEIALETPQGVSYKSVPILAANS